MTETETATTTKCSTCGHEEFLHGMEMVDKMCLQPQCNCHDFTNDPQLQTQEKEGESTKQEPNAETQHEDSIKSNNSPTGIQPQPQPPQSQGQQTVRDNLDTEIQEIREEFRTHFTKCEELIKRLGNAIKKAGIVKENDICHEVKNILAEEIADQKITVRTIDRYCLDEWKRITKPKKDKLSYSKPDQQIVITQDGKSEMLQEEVTRGQQSTEEKPADSKSEQPATPTPADSKSEQDVGKPVTPTTPTEPQPQSQESQQPTDTSTNEGPGTDTSNTAPTTQESQEGPEPQEHEIRLLLPWDSLSEQWGLLGQAHSPGIKWVWLSGVLDEKSGKVNSLKLTNGRAELVIA
jgi:hypothetical protein